MSGTHGDSLLVEDRADIVWVDVLDRERQNRGFFGSGSDYFNAWNVGESFGGVLEQRVLVGGGGFEIESIDVIDRRSKPDAGGDGWCSGFEFIGDRCECRFSKLTVRIIPPPV